MLLVSFLLLLGANADPQAQAHVYIVRMHSYRPVGEQEAAVREALALIPGVWHVQARMNGAAALPTDFVLVETYSDDVVGVLLGVRGVRGVSRQGEHTRALKAVVGEEGSPLPGLEPFGAGELWRAGYTGKGVRVAVFDTGVVEDERYFGNVVERTDWTGERTLEDKVGHGTFVAGLIGGNHPACPGIAPGVELFTFRVFTGAQISYTSWFLDAFNYAMHVGIDVLNLSIGGPDFADDPFTEKVNELTASGIIVVSAIGNDGPHWGSLNNPGDMMEIVGVGGVEPDGSIASFSSRGMTMHELSSPHARYGRVKPDLVTYGRSLIGPSHDSPNRCKRLSGTSVASPVVAGAIALIASIVPPSRRRVVVNPASIKRALLSGATRLSRSSIYEQGGGLLDIPAAAAAMRNIDAEFVASFAAKEASASRPSRIGPRVRSFARRALLGVGIDWMPSSGRKVERPVSFEEDGVIYKERTTSGVPRPTHVTDTTVGPSATFFPDFYDLTEVGCPLMWPHCSQPLIQTGMPVHLNVTIFNPGGVQGAVVNVEWLPGLNGDHIHVNVTVPVRFWPWAAGMGIHLSARLAPSEPVIAQGILRARVVSVSQKTHSDIELPITVRVAPTPAKESRLLWDVFHSVRYPPGYVPRDSLAETKDMLDWLGDHPHTNYHAFFGHLQRAGYYIDILDEPLSCLQQDIAKLYGALLIFDPEDYFAKVERDMVRDLVMSHGMALIVAADWYNLDIMRDIRFDDDNTRSMWSPVVAGANVPALNDLLRPFGVAFGDTVLSGDINVAGARRFRFESGVPIVKFPRGGELLFVSNLHLHRLRGTIRPADAAFSVSQTVEMPLFGITKAGVGAVLAYGDTNCLDTAYKGGDCNEFFVDAVRHTIKSCTTLSIPYKRLLHASQIRTFGLSPTASRPFSVARLQSRALRKLFRPHSRTLELGSSPDDSNDTMDVDLQFRDLSETCMSRRRLESAPAIGHDLDSGRRHFELPSQRRAEPVGSHNNYYTSTRYPWSAGHASGPYSSKFSTETFHTVLGDFSKFETKFLSGLHSMVCGIFLVALSFVVRLPNWKGLLASLSCGSRYTSTKSSRHPRLKPGHSLALSSSGATEFLNRFPSRTPSLFY